ILHEVYGYQMQDGPPSNIPQFSFLAQLNQTTGDLTVNGDPEGGDDQINIGLRAGGALDVNVDGYDLLYDPADVSSITVNPAVVVDTNDTITIDLTNGNPLAGIPCTIGGGMGFNTVDFIGPALASTYQLQAGGLWVNADFIPFL